MILGILALMAVARLSGQHVVKGKLVDEAGAGFPSATIMLLAAEDSVLKSFGLTRADGTFELKAVAQGNYLLQSTVQGMDKLSKAVAVTGETKEVDLGELTLLTKSTEIDGVEIEAERIPVQINGDTIRYDAQAFKTPANANVEELLKRLPGVEVDDEGNVKAQGETVQKVLVDGKEFFGSDPKVATKNLPANAINYVEVLDKQSDMAEFTGVDDGERTKTINLTLKADRKNGFFGDISAGYGNGDGGDHRFRAKSNINRFSEKTQLSFLGMGNNINEQAFSIQDYANFMGGSSNLMSGGGFGRGGSGLTPSDLGISWRGSGGTSQQGISTSAAGGLNYNVDLSPKTDLQSSYFYNFMRKDLEQQGFRENYLGDQAFVTLDTSDQLDKNHNHRVDLRLTHKLDSTSRLIFIGSGRFNTTNGQSAALTQNLEAGSLQNQTLRNVLLTGPYYNANSSLTYMKRFGKRGRSLAVKGSLGGLQFQDRDQLVNSENLVVLDSMGGLLLYDTLDQNQHTRQSYINYGGKVTWTEPLGKQQFLDVVYQHEENVQDLDKDFFNLFPEGGSEFDSLLSNRYEGVYRFDQPGVAFRYVTQKNNLNIGLAGQRSELNGIIGLQDTSIRKVFYNVLPSLRYTYTIKRGSRIRVNYRSSVTAPTIEQLSPVFDNSNPLNVFVGNPDLTAEWGHNVRMNYLLFDQFSFTSLFTMISFTYTKDKINTATLIDEDFRRITTYQNVDRDLNVNWFAYFNTPLRSLGVKVNVNPGVIYSNSIALVNERENFTNSLTSTLDFSVENRKKDWVDVRAGVRTSYNVTRYSIDENQDASFLNNKFYGDFILYLKKGWTFSTSMDYYLYSGDAFVTNQTIPLWRAFISKTFLKNERGEFKLSGFGLLNQNTGIDRSTSQNYLEESQYNTLRRYAMLSFTWKIIQVGKGKSGKPD